MVFCCCLSLLVRPLRAQWMPPDELSKEKIVEISDKVLAMPDLEVKAKEDIFRIRVLEMDWDVGGMVYEPEDASKIPLGPDGKKVGLFLIHGGSGDHRGKDAEARMLVAKFGFKVVTMTYPGRLYFADPNHDWPGDTINPDGSVRTPLWKKDEQITHDQYQVTEDKSLIEKYGTLILACAREGTVFFDRMAAWPVAFEETGKEILRRNLPSGEYSIYIHGHSTGGPFSFMLSQRVANIVGVLGMESSPFGYITRRTQLEPGLGGSPPVPSGKTLGDVPFNCLQIRTWRDSARYAGPEALMIEGPDALMRLPMLMEKVLEGWKKQTRSPQFKAEGMVHFGAVDTLEAAARAVAKRLNLNADQTSELIKLYIGYSRELSGKGVKRHPPVIFGIAQASADHSPERYKKVTLPTYRAMIPPPKVSLVEFKAGTHGYDRPEPGLSKGVFPAVAHLWHEAIMAGYFIEQPEN